MRSWVDVGLATTIAIAWPILVVLLWPRKLRALRSGKRWARSFLYVRMMLWQWALTLAVVAATHSHNRSFSTIGLAAIEGWQHDLTVVIPTTVLIVLIMQARSLRANESALRRVRQDLEPVRPLLPHTGRELALFVPVAFTAGICEEVLFRGYLVWCLEAWTGLWVAVALSVISFAVGHGYQGMKLGIRAAVLGVFLEAMALLTGSIIASMALHVFFDLSAGWVAYLALQNRADASRGTGTRSVCPSETS